MPTWLVIVLAVLSLPVVGTLVTVAHQKSEAGRAEQAKVREQGAAILTPIQEMIPRLSLSLSTLGLKSSEVQRWHEHRSRLMVYANSYPDERVRVLSQQLIDRVGSMMTVVRWGLTPARLPHQHYLKIKSAVEAREHQASEAAEVLLRQIRGVG